MSSNHHIINDYIAGALGGAAGLGVGHPFDTIKVQMQTRQMTSPYKGAWGAMKSINHSGMMRGFFRGLSFPIITYGVINSVFFGVYGNTLTLLRGADRGGKATYGQVFLAGGCGGFFQLFVACPVDVIKVVLQSQIKKEGGTARAHYFHGPRECIQALFRHGGLPTCYRGFGLQLLRDIPASAFYFVIYEFLDRFLTEKNLTDRHGIFSNLMAGGTAGVLSWILVVPVDVVKSHVQADYTGSVFKTSTSAARTIYKTLGIKGFYTGLPMVIIRAFPVNAITFLVYKKSLVYLNDVW